MFLPIATALMGKALYDKHRANDAERQDLDEERQHLRLQRQRQQQQWAKDDQFQASMVNAGRVATVDPNMVKSEEQDNRDVGLAGEAVPTQQGFRVNGQVMASMADAQKAADAHNAPGAVTARMSQALLAAGKPVEAQQLRAGARQEEVGMLQADQLKQAAERDRKLREVGGLIIKGGWASVPEVYSRYQDGYSAKVEPDGKGGATVIGLDESGKEVGRTQYAGLTDFFADVAGQFDPSKWLEHKENRGDKAEAATRWNAEMSLRQKAEDRRAAHEQRMESLAAARNAPQQPAIWDDKADAFLRERYTVKDPNTGTTDVDGNGLMFAKTIAQAAARDKFGGDTTRALGLAFEVDAKIKADAKGGPVKIREARQAILAKLNGSAPAPTPAAPAPAAQPPAPAASSAPAATSAPPAAPAQSSQEPPEGRALDSARVARVQAYRQLMRFGSVQRARDPEGFAAAQAAFEQAKAAEEKAQGDWNRVAASMTVAAGGR